jgi:hypothetical protein
MGASCSTRKERDNKTNTSQTTKEKGEKKTSAYTPKKITTIHDVSLITLGEIKVMQGKILELVSAEMFQENLCVQITEELRLYMEKHSGVVTNRLTHVIEANMDNVEMRIVNTVIANVSQHVLGRLEGKIAAMEERLMKATDVTDVTDVSNLLTPITPRKMKEKEKEE